MRGTAHGYATIVDPDRPTWERDTLQCAHCGAHVFVKPGTGSTVYLLPHRDGRWTEEMGAWCSVCNAPVCLHCHDDGRCIPLELNLERMESTSKRFLSRLKTWALGAP